MTTFIPVTTALTVAVLTACNTKTTEKAPTAAESAPVAQQVGSPGTETARPPTRAATSAPRPPAPGDRFDGQPIDEAWAAQTTSAIEKALTTRFTPEERALLGRIECRTVTCTIDVNHATPDQIESLWLVLRKRVSKDVGSNNGVPVARATDMKVDPPATYFLLEFERDQAKR